MTERTHTHPAPRPGAQGPVQTFLTTVTTLPPPGDLPDPGVEPTSVSPVLAADYSPLSHLGSPGAKRGTPSCHAGLSYEP